MSWPPTVEELVLDLRGEALPGEPLPDTSDTERLQQVLDAAVAYVQRVKAGVVDFGDAGLDTDLPEPDADLRLGTLRLAGRWHTRRRSPDALIQMAEFGAARVPSIDGDIERLLRIGRYAGPVIA